eukprot:CAMPEP_0203665120 /NCGR_PEP_ID=MMETSP0090-20130426/2390_1 /ASSEMBLY_ACC=CAM_ASM_001088 /TAXON_ID=426623 /ORGANISM="Chaetoceros affinis, Strain CCMP159" /LENGTH=707 /DNA_ID=CAMNT_0050528575 /DNA_START=85 /DNA_END=2208 /DNA_ORIENTATION=-
MADQVQASLDRMVPALRDLLDRGIFTESEIKAIVSRRRESEYLLRRLVPRKADYQRYIEAEKNLEKLRSLRKKMVIARQKAKEREDAADDNNNNNNKGNKDSNAKGKSNNNNNNNIGDASIVQNIHLLYVRAKRKWKEDLAWHMQHAEFAKQAKSYQMLGRIYAEALQIHPRNESLWIEAASHEYFGYVTNEKDEGMSGGGSIKSARVLLQRGLRINTSSKNLWMQYFCLELHYIQKLRGRREILQLNLDANGKGSTNQDGDHDTGGSNDDEDDVVAAEIDESVKLPLIIYNNAIKSIPNDIAFRMQFIEQSKLFPETQSLVSHIMKTVESDFENMEDAWIARACFVIDNQHSEATKKNGFFLTNEPNGETDDSTLRKRKIAEISNGKNNVPDDKLVETLREATEAITSPNMFLESIILLRNYMTKLTSSLEEEDEEGEYDDDDDDIAEAIRKRISKIIQFIVQLINEAESKVTVTPVLAIEMVTCLLELGLSSQSLKLMKRLTDENPECKKDPNCWLKIVEISELNGSNPKSSSKILRRALEYIPLHDPGHKDILSRLFMNLLTTSSKASYDEELSSTYEKILLLSSNNTEQSRISIPMISLAYLNYATNKNDINLIRRVYKKLLYNSSYCQSALTSAEDVKNMKIFFDKCLTFEKQELKMSRSNQSSEKRCKHMLNGLFDAAFKYFINIDDNLAHSYNQRGSTLF